MSSFLRGSLTVSTRVQVSADDFWDLLRRWDAVLTWVLPEGVAPADAVMLKDGHRVDVLPCTRVIIRKRSLQYSHEETLIFADPEARRVYYTFNGVPGGIRNYMATTTVDPEGPSAAVITCASSFDLPSNQSMADTEQYLLAAYVDNIARGIEGAILLRKARAAS